MEKHENEHRKIIMENKDIYPNLYKIELRKNHWKFKKDMFLKNKNFNKGDKNDR